MVRKVIDIKQKGYKDAFSTKVTEDSLSALLINLEDERYHILGDCLFTEGEFLSQEEAFIIAIEKNKDISEKEIALIENVFSYFHLEHDLSNNCIFKLTKQKFEEGLFKETGIDKNKIVEELQRLERIFGVVHRAGVFKLIEIIAREERVFIRLDYMHQILKLIKYEEECIDENGEIIQESRKAYKGL